MSSERVKVKFTKLSEFAKPPRRATDGSAGYDMYAARIEEKEDSIIYYTDIATEIPEGYTGFLFPRSSVVKTGMHLGNGVGLLDRDYRGNISFVFYKREGCTPYEVGNRVGQLVIVPIPTVDFELVSELTETERGSGGYGSTGK